MSTTKNFAVSLNLSRYFNDYRQCARIFIKKDIETIEDLQNKISNVFSISNFYLTSATNEFLPPCEDVRILQNKEIVSVVPDQKAELSIQVSTRSFNDDVYTKQKRISFGKRKSVDENINLEQQMSSKKIKKIIRDNEIVGTKTERMKNNKKSCSDGTAVIDEINTHQEETTRKKKKKVKDIVIDELEEYQSQQFIKETPSYIGCRENKIENLVDIQQGIQESQKFGNMAVHQDIPVLDINCFHEKNRSAQFKEIIRNNEQINKDLPTDNKKSKDIPICTGDFPKESNLNNSKFNIVKTTVNQFSINDKCSKDNIPKETNDIPNVADKKNINIIDIVKTTENAIIETEILRDTNGDILDHQNDIPDNTISNLCSDLNGEIKNSNRSIIRNITPIQFAPDSIENKTSTNSTINEIKTDTPEDFKLEVRRRKKQRIFQTPEMYRASIHDNDCITASKNLRNNEVMKSQGSSSKETAPGLVALENINSNKERVLVEYNERITSIDNSKDSHNVHFNNQINNNEVDQPVVKNIHTITGVAPEIKVTSCSIINEESHNDDVFATIERSSTKEDSTRYPHVTTPAKEEFDESISINWDSISSIQDSSVEIAYKSNSRISGLQWLSGASRFSRTKELSGVGHLLGLIRNSPTGSSAIESLSSAPENTNNVMEAKNENCTNFTGENFDYDDSECSTVTFRKRRQRKRKSKRPNIILDDTFPHDANIMAIDVECSSVNKERDVEH